MGQVYEAEELDSGRRVAMKILSRGIGDSEERERFLGEGRVAASLSHPNLVYIFGTSEVQGLPVIAMELAPGGTLKDLLVGGTPMATPAAVDAILQVIAGLDAAASIGILHRDIKPSNCFVDRLGRVVVGDFGLSIATLGRMGAADSFGGLIVGTPGFASPEQLRGEPLDVRSDIYSVGATLYYLLTGRPPFEDANVTTLITRVGSEIPASPATVRRDLPSGLISIVMRCLARTPLERFADYRELATALEPYRSAALHASGPGRRFAAGLLDNYVASLPVAPLNFYVSTLAISSHSWVWALFLLSLPSVAIAVLYYGLLEGTLGAAAGKAMLGIRLVGPEGTAAPGFLRATRRAAIFVLPAELLSQAMNYNAYRSILPDSGLMNSSMWAFAGAMIFCLCFIALFSTARKANGYAGLHDRASATRVVRRRRAVEWRLPAGVAAYLPDAVLSGDARLGPYVVQEPPGSVAHARTIEGYDDRLRRTVWIEVLPCGAAALPALRRDLGRPSRLRWLAGRRTPAECWDAYEAIDGQSLTAMLATPQPWALVRHWLADLAAEIIAGIGDASLPALRVDRVWIGADGRARLLDWAAPGMPVAPDNGGPAHPPGLAEGGQFLFLLGMSAIRGAAIATASDQPLLPLPVAARDLLLGLRDGRVESAAALAAAVDATLRSPAALTRRTRAMQLASCAALPILLPVLAFVAITLFQRISASDPKVFQLKACLDSLAQIDQRLVPKATDAADREAIEVYLAGPLRATIDDPSTWTRTVPPLGVTPGRRALAGRALAAHRNPSPDELQRADAAVGRLLRQEQQGLALAAAPGQRWTVLIVSMSIGWIVAACTGLFGAFVTRGGITLRMFGTAVVRADGAVISRTRALLRAIVAWSPALAMLVVPRLVHGLGSSTARGGIFHGVAAAIMIAGGLWALTHPWRGLQDRIAGTWLVPR